MTNIFVKFVLVALVCNLFPVQMVFAQSRADIARQVQRLDRELQRIGELANSFDNKRAQELVAKAQTLRKEAVELAHQNLLVQAGAKIKIAFSLLEQAAKLTLRGPVRRLRSELEELLRRGEDQISRRHHPEAQRVLDKAQKNRDAAERAVSEVKVAKAVEFFRVGISLASRAISLANQSGHTDVDVIVDIKRKYESLLERARDVVGSSANDRAKQILFQAENLAKSAEQAYRNHNQDLAKTLLNQSTMLLLRAMDLTSGESHDSINKAEVSLFRLRSEMDKVEPVIAASKNPRAKILFERAKRFEGEAAQAMQNDRGHKAVWKIELGLNLVQRAKRMALKKSSPHFSNRIDQEIESTKEEIATARGTLNAGASKDARILLEMSQFAISKAEQASAANLKRVALEAVLASQRFLSRAEQLLDTQDSGNVAGGQVQLKLNQLNAAIAESEESILSSTNGLSLALLQSAKEIRKLSEESLLKGNYAAANEGIQVSFELLRKSLKNASKK